ncbi:MAG: hypothetical protein V3T75_03605, partial [candidate division Zixibacteria bacterium]
TLILSGIPGSFSSAKSIIGIVESAGSACRPWINLDLFFSRQRAIGNDQMGFAMLQNLKDLIPG